MSNTIAINLILGDRTYRIKIENTDEEKVREKAKKLNEQLIQFKKQYAGKDMQDYVAMVLIWYATEISAANNNASPAVADTALTEEALKKLELQTEDDKEHCNLLNPSIVYFNRIYGMNIK